MKQSDDLFCTVFSELKTLGVKVPKVKKFKSSLPKQEKLISPANGNIFGVYLGDQEKVPIADILLPKFIVTSTSYLKNFIKKEIGLFRKAGSISRQRDLRAKLEKGESIEESEPNDVACLLKQWLRELPEPLIPVYLQDLFVRCQSLELEENKVAAVLLCCSLLPPDHLHTLKHLLDFLSDIAHNSDKNKMGAHNLAVIMAPNIFVMGGDSIDKSSSNLVQQHTAIVELLIINSHKVGEIPTCSSLLLSEAEAFKYGTDLDISTDVLDSPLKSKRKRRSGPVQDLFSGFRKLVGQNCTPPHSSKRFSQDDALSARSSVSRSASKRKADPEHLSMSPAKKQATASSILPNEALNFTPNSKSTQNVFAVNEKTGSAHSRRKSFGLLRRKEKKRQKLLKSNAVEVPKSNINTRSPFEENLSTSFQACTEANEVHLDKSSPLLSSSDIDRILSKSTFVKKSVSNCYLTTQNEEFKDIPIFTTSVSQGCLQGIKKSPYSLRSDNSAQKRKTDVFDFKVKSFDFKIKTPVEEKENVKQSISPVPYRKIMKTNPSVKTGSPKKQTLSPKDVNTMAGSEISLNINQVNNVLNDSEKSNPLVVRRSNKRSSSRRKKTIDSLRNSNLVSISTRKAEKFMNENHSVKNNEIYNKNGNATNDLVESNLCPDTSLQNEKVERKYSIKRQEAFIIKSKNYSRKNSLVQVKSADPTMMSNIKSRNSNVKCKNENTSVNSKPNKENEFASSEKVTSENEKNKENVIACTPIKKRAKRNIRNGSIVRGRPNTIRTGLPSDVCSRFNNESISISTRRVLTSTTSVDNDMFINVINRSINNEHNTSVTLQIQNFNLFSPTDSKSTKQIDTKVDIENCTLEANVSVNTKNTLTVPKRKTRDIICSNSDSKVYQARKKSRVSRTNSFPDPVRKSSQTNKKLRAVNSASPRKCKFNSNESKEVNANDQNFSKVSDNNVIKTPDTKAKSPEIWVSGKEFLDAETSAQDVFNKRDSIAMILKNNPGHVLAKVNLYDPHRNLCSTSSTPSKYSTPSETLRNSHSRNVQTRMSQRKTSSVRNTRSSGIRTCDSVPRFRRSPLPPPPKFFMPDTPSPKPSYPLKDISNSEDVSFHSPTSNSFSKPAKDTSPAVSDAHNKSGQNVKPMRNSTDQSYSGHTPYKLPKVLRSESSPALPKLADRLPRKLREPVSRSPSLMIIRNHNIVSNANCFSSPVFRTRSSLSIEKLKPDQLTDEWHCEM